MWWKLWTDECDGRERVLHAQAAGEEAELNEYMSLLVPECVLCLQTFGTYANGIYCSQLGCGCSRTIMHLECVGSLVAHANREAGVRCPTCRMRWQVFD